MKNLKKYVVWLAIIWAANYAGSKGYRVGTALSYVGGVAGSLMVGTANAVNGK